MVSALVLLAAVVRSTDGVPIHYTVQGKGEPALVFVHCWTCDRHLWDGQVAAFARDHRVVALDLAGHGESGRGRKEWSIEAFGQDVKAVADKLGLERMVLVGSSMGGPVILEAARRMPGRVVGLVPVDILKNVDDQMPPDQVHDFLQPMRSDYKAETTKFMNRYLFAASTPAAVKERVIGQATAAPPEIALAVLSAVLIYDPIPALRQTRAPIRAIDSDLTPIDLEANRKYAPQFDAVIMKGVGHYPMLEDPARFNELLAGIVRDFSKS